MKVVFFSILLTALFISPIAQAEMQEDTTGIITPITFIKAPLSDELLEKIPEEIQEKYPDFIEVLVYFFKILDNSTADIRIYPESYASQYGQYCRPEKIDLIRDYSINDTDNKYVNFKLTPGKTENITGLDQPFCVVIESDGFLGNKNKTYYGPYVATNECKFETIEIASVSKANGMMQTHTLVPSKSCLGTHIEDEKAVYTELKTTQKTAHYGTDIVVYERGSREYCQNPDQASEILRTTIGMGKTNQYSFATPEHQEFCIEASAYKMNPVELILGAISAEDLEDFIEDFSELDKESDDFRFQAAELFVDLMHDLITGIDALSAIQYLNAYLNALEGTGDINIGPFKSTTEELSETSTEEECSISIKPFSEEEDDIYRASPSCGELDMYLKNVGYKNYEFAIYTAVNVLNTDGYIANEKLFDSEIREGETKAVKFTTPTSNDDNYFFVNVKHGLEKGQFGPYQKIEGCTLEITSTDHMTDLEVACKENSISMAFKNTGIENYEVALYEQGNSSCLIEDGEESLNKRGPKFSNFVVNKDMREIEYVSQYGEDTWFCVTLKHGTKKGYFGPYKKVQDCELEIVSLNEMTYPSMACTDNEKPDDINMTVKNVGHETYEIYLDERGSLYTCTIDHEELIDSFVLSPNSTKSTTINTTNNDGADFCVTVQQGSKKGYFGPYKKDPNCIINVENTENVTLESKSTRESCEEIVEINMDFYNSGKKNYEVYLYEAGHSADCSRDRGQLIEGFVLQKGYTKPTEVSRLHSFTDFCMTVKVDSKARDYGPYRKDELCKVDIEDTSTVFFQCRAGNTP